MFRHPLTAGLMLLWRGAMATPPAPPPVMPCGLTATSGCDGCAALEKAQAHYDLSSLQSVGDISVPGLGATNQAYHFRMCESIGATSQYACTRSSIGTDKQAVVQWQSVGNDPCDVCGAIEDHKWELQDPTNPLGGVKLTFQGGDEGRTTILYFACDKSQHGITNTGPVQENPTETYNIHLVASAACPVVPIPPPPLSGGWLYIILLGVFSLVYLAAGSFYNKRYRELHGMDVLPQWQYWQQLPGLVKDGCIFSYKKSIWCMHTTRRKWKECKESSGTEELRAPIAAADE